MFAVIEDGGRQYHVTPGDRLQIDLRDGLEAGGNVTFDRVLLGNGGGSSQIGTPLLDGATVTATVVDPEKKGQKLEIQKIRRRKNSRRHTGHRQRYTVVQIDAIDVPGLEIVEKADEQPPANETVGDAAAADDGGDDKTVAEQMATASE